MQNYYKREVRHQGWNCTWDASSEGPKFWSLSGQQYFVWDTASESTKRQDMLKVWGVWSPGYAYGCFYNYKTRCSIDRCVRPFLPSQPANRAVAATSNTKTLAKCIAPLTTSERSRTDLQRGLALLGAELPRVLWGTDDHAPDQGDQHVTMKRTNRAGDFHQLQLLVVDGGDLGRLRAGQSSPPLPDNCQGAQQIRAILWGNSNLSLRYAAQNRMQQISFKIAIFLSV